MGGVANGGLKKDLPDANHRTDLSPKWYGEGSGYRKKLPNALVSAARVEENAVPGTG
jgi:hypothetical protein